MNYGNTKLGDTVYFSVCEVAEIAERTCKACGGTGILEIKERDFSENCKYCMAGKDQYEIYQYRCHSGTVNSIIYTQDNLTSGQYTKYIMTNTTVSNHSYSSCGGIGVDEACGVFKTHKECQEHADKLNEILKEDNKD